MNIVVQADRVHVLRELLERPPPPHWNGVHVAVAK